MSDCARGCTIHGQHRTSCLCTPECRDHDRHCKGCLPTPATLGQLCTPDTDRIRRNLTNIPALVIYTASRSDGKLSPTRHGETDTTRRGTATPTSPSAAWDTADETLQWAHRLALIAADAQHLTGPFKYRTNGVPDTTNLTPTIAFITTNLAWYATHIPTDIYDEVTTTHRTLERLTGRDELIHRLRGIRCPSCSHLTLARDDGSDRVSCRNRDCGRFWREGEFDWLTHVAAS